MSETIYKIGNKILKIGGKLLTVAVPAPSSELIYLSRLNSVNSSYVDQPILNTTGGTWTWNGSNRVYPTGTIPTGTLDSVNGSMPNTYVGMPYCNFARESGILPLSSYDKFTISAWINSNTNGAIQWGLFRGHYSRNEWAIYVGDASSLVNFNLNLSDQYATLGPAGESLRADGCNISTTIISNKSQWHYLSIFVDRTNDVLEHYADGQLVIRYENCPNLVSGDKNFDNCLRFFADSTSYRGLRMCELSIWTGKNLTIPTSPITIS